MKNSAKSKLSKKLLVFGILTVYLCMATACGTNKGNGNGNGSSMAATPESTVTPPAEKGTSATDNMVIPMATVIRYPRMIPCWITPAMR